MKLVLRLLLIVGIGLALQACGDISPEKSCNFVRNSEEQRVSWSNLPVKIFIHNSVPTKHWEDMQAAVDHWNNVASTNLLQIVSFDASGNLDPKRDGINLVTWHEAWDNSNSSEQARTTINWSKTRIYESDIKINAIDFQYLHEQDTSADRKVDLTSLMIHEFGHLLGLAHNEDVDSVMKSQLGFGVKRGYSLDHEDHVETDIKAADLNSMSCEYKMLK